MMRYPLMVGTTFYSYLFLGGIHLLLAHQRSSCHAATVGLRREAVSSPFFLGDTDSPLENEDCHYNGTVLLMHPMSIEKDDKYYVLGSQMLQSAHMTIDQVNAWPRCGISVQGQNYALVLQTYGDKSDKEKTTRIGQAIVNSTDFMLGGYSSSLTKFLAPIAQTNHRLLITAGSSNTALHAENDLVFGMLPPSDLFLDNVFRGTKAVGAKTVAFLTEDDVNSCLGAPEMAEKYDMEFLDGTIIPENSPMSVFEQVARNMSLLDPDLMITCIRTSMDYWNRAMRSVDWTPKAQAYTMVAGTPEFEDAMGHDLAFVMGIGPWDRALPPIPDGASGWTPREFDVEFEKQAFRRPAYQHVSQSAAISILVQAIERVGANLDVWDVNNNLTDRVRETIATGFFPTVFGNTSFDLNGQHSAPYLLLQYDADSKLHVLLPKDRAFTDMELVYPLPTWAWRDCHSLSKCLKTNGTCASDGTCLCREDALSKGAGRAAECVLPVQKERTETFNYIVATVVPVSVTLVLIFLWMWNYRNMNIENDSVWKVNKDELVFADPPEVIGRGTFGLVLLAEFRGTTVAVKSIQEKSRKKHRDGGYLSSMEHARESTQTDFATEKGSGANSGSWKNSTYLTMEPKKGSHQWKQDFIAEMRQVSKLRHPCITTVMGAVVGPGEEPQLILEYMDHGSLYDLIHNETMLLEGEVVLQMLKDISQGCRFLHAINPQVIHGDLKSSNILVDANFKAKVTDFGFSQKNHLGATGTPYWMAPELLRGEASNSSSTDVYSYGIIVYEVYSRKDPYEGEDFEEVIKQVINPAINKRPPVPKDCPPQLASVMCDCVVADPNERPTFEELDKRLKRIEVKSPESRMDRTKISLFDIFPKHIAEALRDGKTVEPEHKDCVTIFFSDIIGFTSLSSSMDPRKVANLLDRLYQKFDELSDKHDVFKVETIGDAYMAVTNLVKDQSRDHAIRIAGFGVDVVKAANETLIDLGDPDKGVVNLRVGFHSGPVVADVVGTRSPRFCLFGDSVNIAARMESNSEQNKIHCSDKSASLLRKQGCPYTIELRGCIEVKGKGLMKTYWVNEGHSLVATNRLSAVKTESESTPMNVFESSYNDQAPEDEALDNAVNRAVNRLVHRKSMPMEMVEV